MKIASIRSRADKGELAILTAHYGLTPTDLDRPVAVQDEPGETTFLHPSMRVTLYDAVEPLVERGDNLSTAGKVIIARALAKAIFDNGGGITLQLGDYGHTYQDIEAAAQDWTAYLATGDTSGWEFGDDNQAALDLTPTPDEIRNGGYRVYTTAEIEAEIASEDLTGWRNLDTFCEALSARPA